MPILCRYPPVLEMQKLMKEAGFTVGPALSLTHETLVKSEIFHDKEGLFKLEWRNGDRYTFSFQAP